MGVGVGESSEEVPAAEQRSLGWLDPKGLGCGSTEGTQAAWGGVRTRVTGETGGGDRGWVLGLPSPLKTGAQFRDLDVHATCLTCSGLAGVRPPC